MIPGVLPSYFRRIVLPLVLRPIDGYPYNLSDSFAGTKAQFVSGFVQTVARRLSHADDFSVTFPSFIAGEVRTLTERLSHADSFSSVLPSFVSGSVLTNSETYDGTEEVFVSPLPTLVSGYTAII